jgi:hypothetical protein
LIIVTSKTTASLELRDSKGVVWSKRHLIINYKKMNITMRTPEVEEKYQNYLKTPEASGCPFCRELRKFDNEKISSVKMKWQYWALMANDYPYGKVFGKHDMLFPLRHVEWGDLTVKEITEYNQIIGKLRADYHQLMENLGERQSQKGHWHQHLARFL